MSKRTLLNLTQNILSAMSSDRVDDIDETTEARQVAEIIRETYEELMAQRDWPHLKRMHTLESLSSTQHPTTFRIPPKVSNIDWVKYNKKRISSDHDAFADVIPLEPTEFVNLLNNRRSTDPNVQVVQDNVSGIPLNIVTNHPPSYFTSFDDVYIVMDSYDSAIENTLQTSKTQCFAVENTEWRDDNDFIPNLPEKMFPMLLAEAKEVALINLKQMSSPKESVRSRRQNNTMQHRAKRQNNKPKWNSYGRK